MNIFCHYGENWICNVKNYFSIEKIISILRVSCIIYLHQNILINVFREDLYNLKNLSIKFVLLRDIFQKVRDIWKIISSLGGQRAI
jgi:hypothetical protein